MSVFAVPGRIYLGAITKTDGTGGTLVTDIDGNSLHVALTITGRRRRKRNRHQMRPVIWTADATVTAKLMSNGNEGLDRILAFFSDTSADPTQGFAKGNLNPLPGEQKKNVALLIIPEESSSPRLFFSPEVSVESSSIQMFYDRSVAFMEGNFVTFSCHQASAYDTEPPWTLGTAAQVAAAHTGVST